MKKPQPTSRMAQQTISGRKNLKRKLELNPEQEKDRKVLVVETQKADADLAGDIRTRIDLLNSIFSFAEADRAAAKEVIKFLSDLARNEENVDLIVDSGAVPALVKHLEAPPLGDGDSSKKPYEREVENASALALGLLAVKPKHQQCIVDAGALPVLVKLLKRHKNGSISHAVRGVIKKAADAIASLAHENTNIKNCVRIEGGIPPLVELLAFLDTKMQMAAAGALKTLAFRNDENKHQIMECNALPTLILMLQSEDDAIRYEAVGVIGNLVHSSPDIKKEVLHTGALQPVIGLLRSSCLETQREAALMLGQFAAADSDCKVHIAQRGALGPLIEMLNSPDIQLKEMSSFALGRLAQDTHNQAGIFQGGGLVPLLKLLDSKVGSLQHNATFALYGLADNEDIIPDIIRTGVVQKLQEGEFTFQPTNDCVAKTLKRVEEKIHGRVLRRLLYLMRVSDKAQQKRVALSFAHFCAPVDQKTIFIDNNGLELLLGLIESTSLKQQKDGSVALYRLATKALSISTIATAPQTPTSQVYLGEQYINNPTSSDVTFLIEGKRFYAHKSCLLATSDIFRAMLNGEYRERDAKDIEIPNIRWEVFELMMRFMYTGSVDVTIDVAQELLRAADQYLLNGLKRRCEHTIAQQDMKAENVSAVYELAEAFNATTLKAACILFILNKFEELCRKPWFSSLINRIIPDIREYFEKILARSPSKPTEEELLIFKLDF